MQPRESEVERWVSRDSWGQRCKGQAEGGGAGGRVEELGGESREHGEWAFPACPLLLLSHQPGEGFLEGSDLSFRLAIPLPVPDTRWALN